MKVVIIGNGLAGTMAAKAIRELEGEVEIEIFGEETYPYYPRPNLIEFLAGRMSYDRIFAFSSDWQTRQRIAIHLGQPVVKIRPDRRVVGLATGREVTYDSSCWRMELRPLSRSSRGPTKKGSSPCELWRMPFVFLIISSPIPKSWSLEAG